MTFCMQDIGELITYLCNSSAIGLSGLRSHPPIQARMYLSHRHRTCLLHITGLQSGFRHLMVEEEACVDLVLQEEVKHVWGDMLSDK